MIIKADTMSLGRYIALLDVFTEMLSGYEPLDPDTFMSKEEAYKRYFDEFNEAETNKAFDTVLDLLRRYRQEQINKDEVKRNLLAELKARKLRNIPLN
jgi:hypothetical protein